ncbi:MAG: translocation/assembly module TamB domain-containing protein [Spirochaetales bacterium]|nr:translocation/assembly module TamB domain-containing protein [Spirochaetales bacterium]
MIRKYLYQFMILSLIITATGLIYIPVRIAILGELENVKSRVIVQWETNNNLKVKYRSISPTIINSLRIREFTLSGDKNNPQNFTFFSDRISLFYRLSLFSGDGSRFNLRRIIVKRGDLYLDLPAGEGNMSLNDLDGLSSRLGELLSRYFPAGIIELRDIDVHLARGNDILVWNIDQLRLNEQSGTINLSHRGRIAYNDLFSTDLTLRGTLSSRLDSLNLITGFSHVDSPYLLMDHMRFQLAYNEGLLNISKVNDKYPLDFSVQNEGDIWKLTLHAENFTPSLIMTPGKSLTDFGELFDMNMKGTLSFTYKPESTETKFSYLSDLTLNGEGEKVSKYLGGSSTLVLKINGTDWDVKAETISLDSPKGFLSYRGALNGRERTAAGNLTLNGISLFSGKKLFSRWNMNLDDGPFLLNSRSLSLDGEELGQVDVSGEWDWEENTLFANLLFGGDLVDSLALDVYAELKESPLVQCWYQLDKLNPQKALSLVMNDSPARRKISGFLEGGQIKSQGYGELKGGNPSFRIDSLDMISPVLSLSLSGYGDRQEIAIPRISWDSESLRGYGSLVGDPGLGNTYQTRFLINDINYDLDFTWDPEERLVSLSGSYGLEGKFLLGQGDSLNLSLMTKGLPLNWNENSLNLDIDISGYFSRDRRAINLNNNRIALVKSTYVSPGTLSFSGIYEEDSLHLNRMTWSDEYSELSGTGEFLLPPGKDSPLNGWITLLSDRDEKYKLIFYRNDGGEVNGYGELENFLVERIPAMNKSGRLTAVVKGSDFFGHPQLEGNLSGEIQDWGELSCLFTLDDKKLLLSRLEGKSGGISFDSGLLTLQREKGELTMSLGTYGKIAQKEWRTGFLFRGTSGDILQPGNSDFSGILKTEKIVYGGVEVSPSLSFKMTREGENVSLRNDDRRILDSYYNLTNGMLQISSEKLFPFSFTCSGIYTGAYMDISVKNIAMDMVKANPFMPLDYASKKAMVEFIRGDLKGELTMEGTPVQPLFNGVFTIDPLQLDTSYSAKDKGVTRMAIDITDNNVTIPYFEMDIGQTGTLGAKGDVSLDGWNLDEFHFDGSLIGRNGGSVPIIYPIKGLALNGEAQGNISFYGTGQQYFIEGDFLLDRLVMSLDQSPRKPQTPPEERVNPWDLKVDLNFTTGKDVTMVIPNEEFHVVKATLDIDQNLRFKLDNIPWVNTLTGDLSIRSGDIAYFDKTFYLSEGNVKFDETQDKFDPLLNVSAEAAITNNGEEVTLMIDYSGSLFSDFNPRFSSIPSYSERELLAMLQPYQSQDGTGSTLALALGTYADKYTFSAPFEEGIKDALNVDMVTIETGFLKNIIEDQLNASQGVYTNDSSQYNVARYLDGTFLNVGKYLGRDLFVAGGFSVKYNEKQTVMSGMGFDLNVKLEMETPFFNIGWTYLPDDLASGSSSERFINDTSITINFRL